MDISSRHSNSNLLILLTSTDLSILQKNINLLRMVLIGVSYYVNFQFAPRRVINGEQYSE